MAVLDWLDDSGSPALWIIGVYPLLILLLGVTCCTNMTRLVQNLPLVPTDPAETREPKEIKDRSTESIPSIESVETRRPAPEDEPSKYKDVKQEEAETTISSAQPSSNHQGALIFTRQIFLARQLGDLIIAQVHEKRCLADMLIGLLAMPVVTMAIMATSGFLGNATALTLRGYRTKEDLKFMNDQCGPWEIFAAVCIRSLLVPWLRILFAFYR